MTAPARPERQTQAIFNDFVSSGYFGIGELCTNVVSHESLLSLDHRRRFPSCSRECCFC